MNWIDSPANGAAEMEQVDVVPTLSGSEIPRREELGGYVTVARASELSGYTDRWIRRLCRRRAIACVQLDDRTMMVEKRSLMRYVARAGRGRGDDLHHDDSDDPATTQ